MHWSERAARLLAKSSSWAYHPGGPAATEPTALAALALLQHGQLSAAGRALAWLARQQNPDGSLGVTADQAEPCWPTSLALLAWAQAARASGEFRFAAQIKRATNWLLSAAGDPIARSQQLSHDSSLVGWPWVLGTHSWVEPTAWSVVALKSVGESEHPRVREAVRLIVDRLLPGGGCNYGNTFILGQKLRPHLEPSGLALVALAGETDTSGRLARTREYVAHEVSSQTTTMSLCQALLGLSANKQWPAGAEGWLAANYERVASREPSLYKIALLILANSRSLMVLQPEAVL